MRDATPLTPPAPTPSNGSASAAPAIVSLAPLRVSGIVVRKADLVMALRVYVPDLIDVQVTEDGEHFWLVLGGTDSSG